MWQDSYDSYQGNREFLMDPWLSMQWHQQQHWEHHWASHWMDAGYGVGSSSSTDTAVQPLETRNNEQDNSQGPGDRTEADGIQESFKLKKKRNISTFYEDKP